MHKLASEVLDFNDDLGELVKATWANYDNVPQAIKVANLTPPRDHQYAVQDGEFKKFALHDQGNVYLSLLYFHHNQDKLSDDLRKEASVQIAANIMRWKDPIPSELKSMADELKGKGVEVVTRERNWTSYDNLNKVMDETGDSDAGKTLAGKSQFKNKENNTLWDKASKSKQDIEKIASESFDIFGIYPINTFDQVKTASVYFKDNWREFDPRERHEYCIKLANRMNDLGIEVPHEVSRYGSDKYAETCEVHTLHRRQFVNDAQWPILDSLVEKIAQVEPETYAEALEIFDREFQLERFWDSQLVDPYKTTFGISKNAESDWRYNYRDIYISEENLKKLQYLDLKPMLGGDKAQKFIYNPKHEFEKLDNDKKYIVARLAMLNQVA